MSGYDQFLREKQTLDDFVSNHFKIVAIREDLSGTWLEWERADGGAKSMQVETANARKYCGVLLIRQEASTAKAE